VPFFEVEAKKRGFHITSESFMLALVNAIQGYDSFHGRFPAQGIIGELDAVAWAAQQEVTIPKGFTYAELSVFQGVIDKHSFHSHITHSKNTFAASGTQVEWYDAFTINNTMVKPMLGGLFLALRTLMMDAAKEMLCEDAVVRKLNEYYFFQDGRYLRSIA
jgi:hypothetical protein